MGMMPWIGAAAGQATDAYNVRSDQNKMMDIQQAQNQRQERQSGMQEETFEMQKGAYQSQLDEDAANKAALYFSAFEAVPDDQKPLMWGPSVRSYKSLFPNNKALQNIPENWDPNTYLALKNHFQGMKAAAEMKRGPQETWTSLGRDPVTQQTIMRSSTGDMKAVGSMPAQTTVNMPGGTDEKEFQKQWATQSVGDFKALNEQARAAEELLPQLEIAAAMDVQTGAIEPLKVKLQGWLESMPGGEAWKGTLANASEGQALTGVMQNVVLSKMQAQKGPQTENDARRIEMTVASLGNTPEAFKFLMNVAISLERRKIDQRDFFLQYKDAKGNLEGATTAWENYKRDVPLVIKRPGDAMPTLFYEYQRANLKKSPEKLMLDWKKAYADQLASEEAGNK